MKKSTRRLIEALTVAVLLTVTVLGAFSANAVSDDPADSYVKQTAANEDAGLSMWFDHSYRKTFTSDKVSTGKDTYSIYMAKNEIESAQVVLYSDTEKTNMNISVTDFTDGKGNTVPAELYYEMYLTTSALDSAAVLGTTAETSFIRAGETPDPVIPYEKLGTSKKPASFKLNAGKSQAFLIRAKSSETTPAGWYSAQLNVYDSTGKQVKTATVYCHVWDFVISDETALQTAFYTCSDTAFGGSYQAYYDYLLENRLNAMDVPGGTITENNPYLTNPRVTAVRVSETGCGSVGNTYADTKNQYSAYADMYNNLSSSAIWDQIKDKLYFYTVDEPMAQEQQDAIKMGNPSYDGKTIDDVKTNSELLAKYWPNAQTVVPFHENHPYPYYTYHKDVNSFADYQRKDATEEMLDTGSVTTWCPQIYAFTPQSALKGIGYAGTSNAKIRDLDGTISGIFCAGDRGSAAFGATYVNWADQYGEFRDRVLSKNMVENENGGNFKLWTYSAGWNKSYTYCNHLIENTGLQTKLLFWQLFQNDITGYLYYATNNWTENSKETDNTVTGAKTTCNWYTNKHTYAQTGYSIYGNGVLFYGKNMAKVAGIDVVGSLRVEILRDGVEEYQMLKMLSDYKGNKAAKNVVSNVSDSVVSYLSMNSFSTAKWGGADEYDIMETVRRNLGASVEAAVAEGQCDHAWNEGKVTVAAGCKTMGEKTFTCTLCGATKTENIPAKHTVGDCFTIESQTEATCTTQGSKVLKCTDCGYRKTVNVPSFHEDRTKYTYEQKTEELHIVKCSVCGKNINSAETHSFEKAHKDATCTEDGFDKTACKYCGFVKEETVIEKTGHNFADGVCTVCGEKDPNGAPVVPGDVDGDGKITAKDVNRLKRIIIGVDAAVPAADVNGDGKYTSADVLALRKVIVQ